MKGDLWIAFSLGSVVLIFSIFILSLRYKLILNFLNEKISLFDSFNIISTTLFISYLSPFRVGSIVTKPIMTRIVSSITYKKSTLVSVFEQFYEMTFQILILPLLVYVIGKSYFSITGFNQVIIIIVLLAGAILAISNSRKIIEFLWRIKFIIPKFIRDFSKKKNISKGRILQLVEKSKLYLTNKELFMVMTIVTIIHFVIMPLTLEFFLISFGYKIQYHLVIAGFWASTIIGRLSGLPSGLGARDVSLGAILVAFGVSLTNSINLVILVRLTMVVLPLLLGVIFSVYNSTRINNFWDKLQRKDLRKIF